jgi:hypothetical protein
MVVIGFRPFTLRLDSLPSCAGLRRLAELCDKPSTTAVEAYRMMTEVRRRVDDELDLPMFLHLMPTEATLYQSPTEGWESIIDKFPGAVRDIEEASKSLALNRYTAGVFHCMRIIERGLRALAKALDITYAPSWESYLKQIDAQIAKERKDKAPAWKKDEEFYAQAASHLRTIKTAWRNPTMHVKGHYTREEALEVAMATRFFMRHLSSRLAEVEDVQ